MRTLKPLKAFTVKRSKWICGGGLDKQAEATRHTALGKGETALLNESGFKCCLGFAVKATGLRDPLLDIVEPNCLSVVIPGLNRVCPVTEGLKNSQFTIDAIRINDTLYTSIEDKEKELIELGKQHNIEINFVP